MSGVAVVQLARREVEHTHEHRGKIAIRLLLAHGRVQLLHNRYGFAFSTGVCSEQRPHNGHQQGSGNALARDIAHTEVKPFVANEEIVEVATDLAGWRQTGIKLDVVALGEAGEGLGNHRLLYVVGYAQLTDNKLLLDTHGLQMAQMSHGTEHDEGQQEQTQQMKQKIMEDCMTLVLIELGGHLRQLAERHIGRQYADSVACGIVDGQRVAAHQQEAVLALVGLAPVAAAVEGMGIPRTLGVVDIVLRFYQNHIIAIILLIDIQSVTRFGFLA